MENPAGPRFLDALRSTVPTKLGKRLVPLATLLAVVAFASGWPSVYAAAALLLGLYAAGHLGTLYAARSLEIAWEAPERVFADRAFPVRVVLRNRGLATLGGIEVLENMGPGEARPRVLERLAPGATVTVEVRGRVRRRGPGRLPAPSVAVRWPFLLAFHLRHAGPLRDVLAYPRPAPVPARALLSTSRDLGPRQTAAVTPRGGEIIRGLREWAPGDPSRAIAWRATARHARLLSREFEEEDGGRAVVILDADARDLPARERRAAVEKACSLASSLLRRLRARGRRTVFAARIPEPVLVPSIATARGLGRALEALALLHPPARQERLPDPLDLVPAATLRGARIVRVRAAPGEIRTVRGPRGLRETIVPAFRATFRPPVRP